MAQTNKDITAVTSDVPLLYFDSFGVLHELQGTVPVRDTNSKPSVSFIDVQFICNISKALANDIAAYSAVKAHLALNISFYIKNLSLNKCIFSFGKSTYYVIIFTPENMA